MNRSLSLFALLSALILVLTACGGNDAANSARDEASLPDPASVLATWEDAEIPLGDYLYFYRTTQSQVEYQVVDNGDYTEDNILEFWYSANEDGSTMEQLLQQQSFFDTARFATLHKLASDAGVTLEPEETADSVSAVDSALQALSEDPEAAAGLFWEQYGVPPEQMKDIYARMDLVSKYLNGVAANTDATEDEIIAFYDANPEAYAQVRVRHILVSCTDDMPEEEQEAAEAKAQDILAQIQGGADIGDLAAQYSDDPGSKDSHGEYTFPRGQMVPEFEDWAFSANVGDQGIVKTVHGYHVMEMMGRMGALDILEELRVAMGNERVQEIVRQAEQTAETGWTVNEELLGGVTVSGESQES